MRRPHTSTEGGSGPAARLAAALEEHCQRGIALRARGTCACAPGVPGALREPGRTTHDDGCATLGISRKQILRFLKAAGDAGATALLSEAVEDAIRELEGWGASWDPVVAGETVSEAIRCRITPREQSS